MSSLARRSSDRAENSFLGAQVTTTNPISKTRKYLLLSFRDEFGVENRKFLISDSSFSSASLEEFRFSDSCLLILELFASLLSFSCLLFRKKLTHSNLSFATSFHASTPLTTNSDQSPPQTRDFETSNGSVINLLDLDEEDSELIPEEYRFESDHDHLQSSFPSPSYKSSSVSTNSGISTSFGASDLEDLTLEEQPLFAWNSRETWRCFTMSPRRDVAGFRSCWDDIELRTERSIKPALGLGLKGSKIADKRRWNEAEKASELSGEEVSIELLLGLCEFDGHEGLDSEFNQYDFSLNDSLS